MDDTVLTICCPVCGEALRRQERAYVCGRGHSFDIARQGYVNLLTADRKHSRNPGDTRDMVASRRSFLDRGHYRPIAGAVCRLLEEEPLRDVLDAGCGEGYYLSCLQEHFRGQGKPLNCVGVDISREAVRWAAARNKDALWVTASAAHLPLADGSMDAVLSMFALTVPAEFRRVLHPGGCFLEVTAGRGHLLALKRLIYAELHEKPPREDVCPAGFRPLREEMLTFPVKLESGEEVRELLGMTPHFWRITREGAARAAAAEGLYDTAQIRFRLYRRERAED